MSKNNTFSVFNAFIAFCVGLNTFFAAMNGAESGTIVAGVVIFLIFANFSLIYAKFDNMKRKEK